MTPRCSRVPDAFTRDVIESQLRTAITEALSRHLGRPIQVAVTVRPPDEATEAERVACAHRGRGHGPGPAPTVVSPAVTARRRVVPGRPMSDGSPRAGHVGLHHRDERIRPTGDGGNRLNPKYTFETFVIGSSNRFAHAAAVAVAESPAKAYNPLFIYGDSGLGKTHLLHAIGHYATTLGTAKTVRYVSTEEFTNDFINSLRDDKTNAFQRRYRTTSTSC